MDHKTFVYVTYIATTQEKLWEALTSGEFTKKYWFGHEVQSTWEEGTPIIYLNKKGEIADKGVILKSEPYEFLAFSWGWVGDPTVRERSPKVTYELKQVGSSVRFTLKHEDLLTTDISDDSEEYNSYNNGWPVIISSLKSLLETGSVLNLGDFG